MKLKVVTPIIYTADDYHDFDFIQQTLIDATGEVGLTYKEGEELIDSEYVAVFFVKGEEEIAEEILLENYDISDMLG